MRIRANLARRAVDQGSGGSRGSRSGLGRSALRDHAGAGAVATGAATGGTARAAAAVARAAAALAGAAAAVAGAALDGSLTVATMTAAVATLATLAAVATLTTMAALAAMAAVTGDGRRVGTRENDHDHREEHRSGDTKETLHENLQKVEPNARSVAAAVTT